MNLDSNTGIRPRFTHQCIEYFLRVKVIKTSVPLFPTVISYGVMLAIDIKSGVKFERVVMV